MTMLDNNSVTLSRELAETCLELLAKEHVYYEGDFELINRAFYPTKKGKRVIQLRYKIFSSDDKSLSRIVLIICEFEKVGIIWPRVNMVIFGDPVIEVRADIRKLLEGKIKIEHE